MPFSQPRSWRAVAGINNSVLLSKCDRADLPVCPSQILFSGQWGQEDCVDASTPAELVEKRRKGGSEKRSIDGVERKRREKTLDGSPMEASLRGMVEVQSESNVGRVSLQEAAEKGGPWPFIL